MKLYELSLTIFLLLTTALAANNWATYPAVPKTASINGFADPIYDLLPQCAKRCVTFSTGNTPCPYWDTGCFCVMPQWSGLVGQCVAESCKGEDVDSATQLATSLCYKVGANTWMMPASISTALSSAAGVNFAVDVSSDLSGVAASSTSGPSSGTTENSDSITTTSNTGTTSSTSTNTSSSPNSSANNGLIGFTTSIFVLLAAFLSYLI